MDKIWRQRFSSGYKRLNRPVLAGRNDYAHGSRETWHSHEQAQLVYATKGIVRVLTSQGAWVVASHQALWIAPSVEHELHMVGEVTMCDLRIEPDTAHWLWPECRLIRVSPLLCELILGMLENPPDYAPDSNAALIVPLLLRKLRDADVMTHGKLPLPWDKRLVKICEVLMCSPANNDPMTLLCDRVGISARTLNRRFKEETGLTFGQWRTQLRLTEAVCQLSLGQPVNSVARNMGYATANAFSAMFRRTLGDPPQRYLRASRI